MIKGPPQGSRPSSTPKLVAMHMPPLKLKKQGRAWPSTGAAMTRASMGDAMPNARQKRRTGSRPFAMSHTTERAPHQKPPYMKAFEDPGLWFSLTSMRLLPWKTRMNSSEYSTLPDR